MIWYDVMWCDIWYYMIYDMIYLLTAIGLSPSGSTHLHTNNTQNNTNNNTTNNSIYTIFCIPIILCQIVLLKIFRRPRAAYTFLEDQNLASPVLDNQDLRYLIVFVWLKTVDCIRLVEDGVIVSEGRNETSSNMKCTNALSFWAIVDAWRRCLFHSNYTVC
jgi:hypothetical protein